MLRRAVEIELELAVLVDRAERRDRRRPLAVLAEALAPELHIPGGEARQPVAIGQHDVRPHAALLGEADGDGRTDGRREVACGAVGLEQRLDDALRAPSRSASTSRPAGERRQKPDIGQAEKRPPMLGS